MAMYKRILFQTFVAVGAIALLATGAFAVTMEYTNAIGDLNNAGDSTANNWGSVSYEYQIGKYEVTVGQYLEFLNAKASSNALSLYDTGMLNGGLTACGIEQNGEEGSYTYTLTSEDKADLPIAWVNFWRAARFANWMENGQGTGDTETGSYTIPADWDDPNSETYGQVSRNAEASVFVASNDEWHKAAYYDPTTETYWDYATQTDSENPPQNLLDGDTNRANVFDGTNARGLLSVGTYTNATSYYGTYDQTGNVREVTDTSASPFRLVRDGPWNFYQSNAAADRFLNWWAYCTVANDNGFGFRLVTLEAVEPPGIPGDTNGDDIVDETDATTVAGNWGDTVSGGATDGDFNGDNIVDAQDASIMAANWGDYTEGGESTVPEPSMVLMLLAGITMVVVQRRR